ncbi:MAG: signal peptide peptidase SppA [Xanthomonadales bacterium]
MNKERSLPARILLGIWRVIDGARKFALNLVFFLIVYLVIVALIDSGDHLIVQPDTALVLRPQGDIVEQYSGTPLDHVIMQATESGRQETRLRDLVESIRRGAQDPKITRMVIDPNEMRSVGLAALLELENAIDEFRATGKPIVALVDNVGQQQYFLAALADEVWLNPMGLVWLDGFAAYRQFYREGLDKLEVEVNLFRVGKYKSAMEPFIRDDMSPEAKEANLHWIGDLWYQYLEAVSRHRGVPVENLTAAINGFADRLEAVDGNFARFALDLGLVDQLISRPEALLELARRGAPAASGEGFRQIDHDNYLAVTALQQKPAGRQQVAIVVAEGEIVQGRQPQGTVGAATLAEKLRTIGEDSDVQAVVLRVNSPGGDAFAAEKIRRELMALKEAGKTVVVSMGDVAASGGYWIAMGADEVWASPSTITGSIGVFGIAPTFSKPLARLGIHTDGVGTTELAGKMRLDRPMDDDLKRIFQAAVERSYADFITLVAAGRGQSPAAVQEVAQGRVWSGGQALEHGLVDQTGTLQQAIDSAARIAGLGTDYEAVYDEWEISPFEAMLLDMTGGVATRFGAGQGATLLRLPLVENILSDLRLLAGSNGGLTVAAHCLCGVE